MTRARAIDGEQLSIRDRGGDGEDKQVDGSGRLSTEFKINLTIHVHTSTAMLTTKIAGNKIGPVTLCGRAASSPLRGSTSP